MPRLIALALALAACVSDPPPAAPPATDPPPAADPAPVPDPAPAPDPEPAADPAAPADPAPPTEPAPTTGVRCGVGGSPIEGSWTTCKGYVGGPCCYQTPEQACSGAGCPGACAMARSMPPRALCTK
jgi:hypothetical protein